MLNRMFLLGVGILIAGQSATMPVLAAESVISIEKPLPPPAWALLERELLRSNTAACQEFYKRYFDDQGYFLCVERWGGDDGPDDAIENCADWPTLHALGASDVVLQMYKKAWEGHLRQFTLAKTVEVPFARDGMYYKEFPVMFDWVHNAEGLMVFNLQGLSDPEDIRFGQRVRRFAGFYLNEDPAAPNYDPQHKIIRSLFNGSRGPLLRKATAVDWAGDPIEVENRFRLGHGEHSYQEMLDHFKDYNDVVGDNPLNLLSTTLAANAFMLTHEERYKRWLLEYVDAWRERMLANGGIIPSNVGLDGKIGSEAGGKWYGGVYGWGFTVLDPGTRKNVHRNVHSRGFGGFMNAYLLTGDDRYLDPWRKQMEKINAQQKMIDGKPQYPHMHGDQGWYDFKPEKYALNALEIYYLSMKPEDRKPVATDGWLAWLEGNAPGFPEQALRADLDRIRMRVAEIRDDASTPDTRLSDDALRFNPASIMSLLQLTMGGINSGKLALPLSARVRYFDPTARRAGLPEDVAALVEKMSADETTLTLVNVNQLDPRTVVVQGGAYGEHQINSAAVDGRSIPVNSSTFTVNLAPGSGQQLVLKMKRYMNAPTLAYPWRR